MYLGINLAGAEFGSNIPGEFNKDYTFPTKENIKYYADAGIKVIRLPYKWERFNQDVDRIRQFLNEADELGCKVVLDCHNYCRYNGQLLQANDTSLATHWAEVVSEFKDHPAIRGWGIMNEPHDTEGRWPAIAQRVVDAIRELDDKRIYVMGDHWGGAHSWKEKNNDFRVDGDNIIYEAHQYFDNDSSGQYDQSYSGEGATPTTGVERLAPFTAWLKENNFKGIIGEYGVPRDTEWLVVMNNFAKACATQGIEEIFYWAGGPWWGDYKLSAENNAPQYELMKSWGQTPEPEPEPEPIDTWLKTKTWEADTLKEVEKGMDSWLYSKNNRDKQIIKIEYVATANKFGGVIVYK